MKACFWPMLYLVAAACGGCTEREARLPLGSDHFISMQNMVRSVSFAKATVYLDKDCGGRGDGEPDLEVTEAGVLEELRLALLDAQYDGPDLSWFGPGQAYGMIGDGHDMEVRIVFSSRTRAGEDSLSIHVHGCRFSFEGYGFAQDSFQSPRLARLIRNRLLPPTASETVGKTLDYLKQGVPNETEWSRGVPGSATE